MSGPKNNCLILGAGRSGTSLTASLLVQAGYHGYKDTFPADEANPLGYFEDVDVVAGNESILDPIWRSPRLLFSRAVRRKPHVRFTGGAWLLDLEPSQLAGISLKAREAERFTKLFAHRPFAYKDPRFSFTLAALAPVIPQNTLHLCIFRDPLQVVESTRQKALQSGVKVSENYCFSVWEAHYRCLLEHHRKLGGQWLFVNYQELIDGTAVARMEDFLKVRLNRTQVKPELNRMKAKGHLPGRISVILGKLQELSTS
jgi:hypothetical protein